MKRSKKIILVTLAILMTGCAGSIRRWYFLKDADSSPESYYTIWALSDIHLDAKNTENFEQAVTDAEINIRHINMAIVAGDIVDYKRSGKHFQWYVNRKKKSSIPYWYEIAGNHDYYDYLNFKKYINVPLYYAVRKGNMLILFLSDENRKTAVHISDKTFQWWKKQVIANQNSIIITVTHGPLEESGLYHADYPVIKDSNRFAKVLEKYSVDIWINGHIHMPHRYINYRYNTVEKYNNTLFLNVASIVRNHSTDTNSCVLFFKKNSNTVLIRSGMHDDNSYLGSVDNFHTVRYPFIWKKNKPSGHTKK
ncbi:MAG: hypothetical protein GY754_42335 [bacterium]|nr:hypothetical protein [bacterium]